MRVFSVPLSAPFLRKVIAALVDGRLIENLHVQSARRIVALTEEIERLSAAG